MQVRDNLELSFVQEAEMVFTTLSSTGRKIFSHLENAFENVLVDEAAQASEIAVLQPLMLGCKRCVSQSFIDESMFPVFNTHQGSQHMTVAMQLQLLLESVMLLSWIRCMPRVALKTKNPAISVNKLVMSWQRSCHYCPPDPTCYAETSYAKSDIACTKLML